MNIDTKFEDKITCAFRAPESLPTWDFDVILLSKVENV